MRKSGEVEGVRKSGEVEGMRKSGEMEGVRKSGRKGRTSNSTIDHSSSEEDESASYATPELIDEFTVASHSPSLPSTSHGRREKKAPTQPPIKPRASGRKVRKTIEATEAEEGEGVDYSAEEMEFDELVHHHDDSRRKGKGRMGDDEGDEEEGEGEDGEEGEVKRGKGRKVSHAKSTF